MLCHQVSRSKKKKNLIEANIQVSFDYKSLDIHSIRGIYVSTDRSNSGISRVFATSLATNATITPKPKLIAANHEDGIHNMFRGFTTFLAVQLVFHSGTIHVVYPSS